MNRAVVISAMLLTLLAGLAVATHHETDVLIKLDKEWGVAAHGQRAVDAISRIISDDVLAIGVDGLGSKATMIEATQDEDEPTELELYCKEHPDAEKCQDKPPADEPPADEPTELELYCKEHPDAEKCQDNAGG